MSLPNIRNICKTVANLCLGEMGIRALSGKLATAKNMKSDATACCGFALIGKGGVLCARENLSPIMARPFPL
jgi:hypothetical protein